MDAYSIKTYSKKIKFLDGFFVNLATRYFKRKNIEFSAQRKGRMVVFANDWIGSKIYLHGTYEKEELNILSDLLGLIGIDKANATAVDVGSNIGNHSIFFAEVFKKVYSIEPSYHSFRLLSMNLEPYPNAEALHCGLGDKAGEAVLSENIGNYGSASAIYNGNTGEGTSISLTTLDSVFSDVSEIGLIKIDVEGMEYSVLKGGVETLRKHEPVLAFEQHESDFIGGTFETPSTRLLKELGYLFCWIEEEQLARNSWLRNRLRNIVEIFNGKTQKMKLVTGSQLPARFHSMLVAIPPKRHAEFGKLMSAI